jgi:hypothetical protein
MNREFTRRSLLTSQAGLFAVNWGENDFFVEWIELTAPGRYLR